MHDLCALASPTLLGAAALREWAKNFLQIANANRELIDSFNHFPVPDQDTGTNVALTLHSAAQALTLLPRGADAALITKVLADASLRGARGNSGLLISQALSALAAATAAAAKPAGLSPAELTAAYEQMPVLARQAVSHPVAGTFFAVAQEAARAARYTLDTAASASSVLDIASAAALGAQEAVVETAGLGYGSIDAGGAAFMLLLTTLADALICSEKKWQNLALFTPAAQQMLVELAASMAHAVTVLKPDARKADVSGEFEVMYLYEATNTQAQQLRQQLEKIGDSVGVIGVPDVLGVGIFQVHVHTDTPRAALPLCGSARQICIHHLRPTPLALSTWDSAEPSTVLPRAQNSGNVVFFEPRPHLGKRSAQFTSNSFTANTLCEPKRRLGIIACTRAPGLLKQLSRTGAVVVLNPQRDAIIRAAGDLGTTQILVLPCDEASAVQAHEAARYLAMRALPTQVVEPGQASALAAYSPQLFVADCADEASVLAAAVAVVGPQRAQSITYLLRQAALAVAHMRTLVFNEAQTQPEQVVHSVTAELSGEDKLVTVILGRRAAPDLGMLLANAVAQRAQQVTGSADRIEVVVHDGAQDSPDVLVAIE